MKILQANRLAPDGAPRFAASHLGLFCLRMSHKKDAKLISVYKYQRTNGPVNAHLISWPSKAQQIQNLGNIW